MSNEDSCTNIIVFSTYNQPKRPEKHFDNWCIMTVLFFICSRLSTTLLLQAGTNDSTGFHYTPVVEFEVRFQKTREITKVTAILETQLAKAVGQVD